MTNAPARLGVIFLLGLSSAAVSAQTVDGTSPPAVVTGNPDAAVPVASVAPAGPGQPAVTDMLHTDAKGRHLAPHGTLYLLEYVSAKTDRGVEGFEPGTEVHVVEAHRATQTLVVTNGRAQIELSPSKLTHDMDIAALVRRKDQADQTQIAAYVAAEEAAYKKATNDAAQATAKDLDRYNKEQKESSRIVDNTLLNQPAQPADATVSGPGYYGGSGYYGSGSYGYGSPYSYFPDGGDQITIVNPPANAAPGVNPASRGTASTNSPAGKTTAPGGGAPAGALQGGASSGIPAAAQGTAGRPGR